MDEDDAVFKALADGTRRALLDLLHGSDASDGSTLRELCAGARMSRQAVSKHLDVLETAGLVTTRRIGRTKRHHLDAAPIRAIREGWLAKYSAVPDRVAPGRAAPERAAPERAAGSRARRSEGELSRRGAPGRGSGAPSRS